MLRGKRHKSDEHAAAPPNTPTRHNPHGRYPKATLVESFEHNLHTRQSRIESACLPGGP
jgi:hypothetical protein